MRAGRGTHLRLGCLRSDTGRRARSCELIVTVRGATGKSAAHILATIVREARSTRLERRSAGPPWVVSELHITHSAVCEEGAAGSERRRGRRDRQRHYRLSDVRRASWFSQGAEPQRLARCCTPPAN
jgi:hypothetical protein